LQQKKDTFPFLDERLSKEPHIYEVMGEIYSMQKRWLSTRVGELATLPYLEQSREIKLPQTQKRGQNILYLIEQLVKQHPEYVKPVFTFEFNVNPETKALSISERAEFTISMPESELSIVRSEREGKSIENLNELIKKFRLFNITKLIKISKQRNLLSQLIKSQLGKTIFTYKNHSFDRNGIEISEDYCFHKDNFQSVKSRINFETTKSIITTHATAIERRLKSFGILNCQVSDYRDSKMDYILNILTGDMAPALDKKDTIDIKNFKSIRECILKVDKILDPVKQLGEEIRNFITEKFIVTEKDLFQRFIQLDQVSLTRWEAEYSSNSRLIVYQDGENKIMICGKTFVDRYRDLTESVIFQKNDFENLDENGKKDYLYQLDFLTDAAQKVLSRDMQAKKIFDNTEAIFTLKQLIKDFEDYKRASAAQKNQQENTSEKSSVLISIINAVLSIFTKRDSTKQTASDKTADNGKGGQSSTEGSRKKAKSILSGTTRDVYRQIKHKSSPIIALSDLIEIKPENESQIDQIITELRENNIKTVIPIYNARKVLYPNRSTKYLTADVEYILVDTEVSSTPETVRNFTDSIAGYKFKEDTISSNALFTIEKYLMTIYRQNRAKAKRAKMLKK